MKTLLICHEGAFLDQEGLARWLASFSDLVGIVVLREKNQRKFRRIQREVKRVGLFRFIDVTTFRFYYRLGLAKKDKEWEENKLAEIRKKFPKKPDVPVLITHSPNSREAENFIKAQKTDVIIARCKVILTKRIFSLAKIGTFVMHPGICPEYRNAHGCFWALANDENDKVGMTLLQIDEGVDTGPVYGYYTYNFDSLNESHIRIQNRVVLENLTDIKNKLLQIEKGEAQPIDVSGRKSGAWGHPWLSRYIIWKRRARREGK